MEPKSLCSSIFTLDGMSYTLHYRSSRKEVWRWYWSAWCAKLWRTHVFFAVFVAFLAALSASPPFRLGLALALFVVVLPVITLLFAAFPQFVFKGKERTLNIGPEGWSTQIGRLVGTRTWGEVVSVEGNNSTLAITGKNGNALVIPLRALPNPDSWRQFVNDVQAWHQAYRLE
ncbi:MAG: hypothetical protein LBI48_10495 [Burkholderiaceae bacterium]|jgi:hypothetical protein|nr:hypothetical protein [Burkholderiaceae bacterium]